MAAEKRTRPVKGFYRGIERHIRLKAEKIRLKKAEKVDQEKMYPIEVSAEIVQQSPTIANICRGVRFKRRFTYIFSQKHIRIWSQNVH